MGFMFFLCREVKTTCFLTVELTFQKLNDDHFEIP